MSASFGRTAGIPVACDPACPALDEESINYFKAIPGQVGIPYQSLINLYLRECAASRRKPNLSWK